MEHCHSENAAVFEKLNLSIADTIIKKSNTTFLIKIENYEKSPNFICDYKKLWNVSKNEGN